MTEELKQEAKYYAKRLFDEKEQAYLHDMVVRVYMESAEPREKRITELEVTNKKISDECHKLVDSLEKKQKEVVDLENEKAELQEKLEGAVKAQKQLKKAKEIIKNLVEFDSSYKDDEEYQCKSELYDKIWEEAEQFLKEN